MIERMYQRKKLALFSDCQIVYIEMCLTVETTAELAHRSVANMVHFHQLGDLCGICADFLKGQGHADFTQESLKTLHAL